MGVPSIGKIITRRYSSVGFVIGSAFEMAIRTFEFFPRNQRPIRLLICENVNTASAAKKKNWEKIIVSSEHSDSE